MKFSVTWKHCLLGIWAASGIVAVLASQVYVELVSRWVFVAPTKPLPDTGQTTLFFDHGDHYITAKQAGWLDGAGTTFVIACVAFLLGFLLFVAKRVGLLGPK